MISYFRRFYDEYSDRLAGVTRELQEPGKLKGIKNVIGDLNLSGTVNQE